ASSRGVFLGRAPSREIQPSFELRIDPRLSQAETTGGRGAVRPRNSAFGRWSTFPLLTPPLQLSTELRCSTVRGAPDHAGVGRKRQRNPRQLVDPESSSHGDRNRLDDIDRSLADDVTAKDPRRPPVGNQLAEAGRPAVD